MTRIEIDAVLAPYRDRSANYGELVLFDHLPMTVAALAEMGADAGRVARWARHYARAHDLRAADAGEIASRRQWREQIAAGGAARVFAQSGTGLCEGIGAAAFHAAIRAAYARERGDDAELAAALAAWENEYFELPRPAEERAVGAPEALAMLAAAPVVAAPGGIIVTRMAAVGRRPGFARIAAAVPPAAALDELALAAAAAFARSGNFTTLHVMTGTFALRVLAGDLPDPTAAMSPFWRAYAAAALAAGPAPVLPTLDAFVLDELRAEAPVDWAPLLAAAVAHDDEHVIKATYTAWRLDRAIGDPVFRTAAHRYLQRSNGG